MRMRCTIDRFEQDRAVLRTDDGQTLVVHRAELPANVVAGGVILARFTDDATATADRHERARTILNELLGTDKE